jgi:hypothetical protein
MKKKLFSLTLLTPFFLLAGSIDPEELVVDLKNPKFNDGELYTDEGGVVSGNNLRIQAKNISYHTTIKDGVPQRLVKASGDLFVVFKDKPFVAESIEYDFATGKGIMHDGRTYVDLWYLGGKELVLNPDGSFEARNAFITTSANKNASWEFHSSSMKVNKRRSLSVKNLSIRLFKIPVFWMPTFKASMRFFKDPLIKYKVTWDKNIGPRFTARYQFLGTERFDLFLRSDTRVTAGKDHEIKAAFGGAIESIYKDPSNKTQFLTRNYYANDKIVPEEKGPHRYRFQGLFKHVDEDERSIVYLSYDKLSDQSMISDFKSDDFVVNTEKRSYFYVGSQEEDVLFRLSVQPRLNRFQSITEEYPKVLFNIRSQDLGSSGIIANSDSSVAYLNYKYAIGLYPYFRPYHSFRMQTVNELYRPIHLGGLNLNPKAGAIAIYYSNTPEKITLGQLAYHYGLDSNVRFVSSNSSFSHVVEPYINYSGYSKPWISPDAHYYFYLDDGLSKLNTVQGGVRQSLNFNKNIKQINVDLFALSFCQGFNYPQIVGRYGANLELYFSRFFIKSYFLYNVGASHLDYINAQGSYTFSKDFALFLEYRNRGPYAWRKSDYENYFLDVARPNSELVTTPISDKRQTILGKIMLRLSPRVTTQLAGHYGFGRKTEPSYKSTKVDFNFSIGGSWNLKIGYQHSPDNDRFTTNFYLSP